jgi:SHS2 domain-containing protein
MAIGRMLFNCYEVRIGDASNGGLTLDGVAYGEPVEPVRHQPAVEIKGATHTELRVEERPDGRWLAQCVVDV